MRLSAGNRLVFSLSEDSDKKKLFKIVVSGINLYGMIGAETERSNRDSRLRPQIESPFDSIRSKTYKNSWLGCTIFRTVSVAASES